MTRQSVMNQSSDTPPNGDFARYIEQLMSANAAKAGAGVREDLLHSPAKLPGLSAKTRAARAPSPSLSAAHQARTPAVPAYSASLIGKELVRHLRWLLFAWIGLQLLGLVWGGAAILFVPLLLAYVGWLVFRLRRNSSGELMGRFQAWAQKIAEQSRKP